MLVLLLLLLSSAQICMISDPCDGYLQAVVIVFDRAVDPSPQGDPTIGDVGRHISNAVATVRWTLCGLENLTAQA